MCVYWIIDREKNLVKVGSAKEPLKRLAQLQVGNGSDLFLLGVSDTVEEKAVHELYSPFRKRGEWFEWNDLIGELTKLHLNYTYITKDNATHPLSAIEKEGKYICPVEEKDCQRNHEHCYHAKEHKQISGCYNGFEEDNDCEPCVVVNKTILTPEKKKALEELIDKFLNDTDEYVPSFLYEDKNLSKEYDESKKLLRKRFKEIIGEE